MCVQGENDNTMFFIRVPGGYHNKRIVICNDSYRTASYNGRQFAQFWTNYIFIRKPNDRIS